MAKKAAAQGPTRKYLLRIEDDVYVRYQEFARELGITLGRLFNETVAYGLGDGAEAPEWWGSPEHRKVSPDIPADPNAILRAPGGMPVRSYSLSLPVRVHSAYQRLALDLNVTMSRLFREVLQFGLRNGEGTPSWWDEWQARAAQESLIDVERQESPVSP